MDHHKVKIKLCFNVTEDEQLIEMVQMHQYLYDLQHPLHNEQSARENAWQEISQILERPVEDCKRRWKNIKDAHRRRRKLGKYAGASKSPLVKLLSFLDNVESRKRSRKIVDKKINNENRQGTAAPSSTTIIKTEPNKDFENFNFDYNLDNDDSMDENLNNNNNDIITDTESTTLDFPDPLSTLQQQRICEQQEEQKDDEKIIEQHSTINEKTISLMQKDLKMLKRLVERQEDSVDLFFRSLSMTVKNLRPDLINEAKIKMLQLVIDLENQNMCNKK